MDQCTRQFQQAALASGVRRGPSAAFCVILRQYSDCLRSTARSCRGHLAYHSTITLVHNWNGDSNCSYVGAASKEQQQFGSANKNRGGGGGDHHSYGKTRFDNADDSDGDSDGATAVNLEPTARSSRPEKATLHLGRPSLELLHPSGSSAQSSASAAAAASTACTYQGRPEMTHCSFYGDPHLVTFNNEFQTCKVAGAWPLIDNAYLAVSVTNEAVVPGSSATATTKVNI